MQWLIDFFVSIFQTLSNVINFAVNAVLGLFDIIKMLPQLLTNVTASVSNLPSILSTFVLATITVSVIFLLIGRGEGGD